MRSIRLNADNLCYFNIPTKGNVVIPSRVTDTVTGEECQIISIGDCFRFNEEITAITVLEGVLRIHDEAFQQCVNLRSVVLPNSLECIEEYAFDNCESLKTIVLGGVTQVGVGVFSRCKSLEQVCFPQGLLFIGENTFRGCMSLKKVEIPSTVAKMFDRDYMSVPDTCVVSVSKTETTLTENELREQAAELKLTKSGINSFHIQTAGHVVIPEYLTAEDGTFYRVTEIGSGTFYNCTELKTIALPSSVRTIETGAFMGCTEAELTIPSTVVKIEGHAFDGVKSIVYHGNAVGAPWGARVINPNASAFL